MSAELKSRRWKPEEANCHYCGRRIWGIYLTKDHIIPKTEGGEDTPDNVIWACKPCNNIKSAHSYDEFIYFIAALKSEDFEILRTFPLSEADQYKPSFRKLISFMSRKYNRFYKIKIAPPKYAVK